MDDWKDKLAMLAAREFDHATMTDIQLVARAAVKEIDNLRQHEDEASRELERLNYRIMAVESALRDLLDAANPHTDEEQRIYEDCARHAELLLRGGEPEGERKNSADLT